MFSPRYVVYRPFILLFVISCVLLSGFTYILYNQAQESDKAIQLTLKSYDTIRKARLVLVNAVDIETGQRGYLLTRSPEFLEPYQNGLDSIDQTLADLKNVSNDYPDQKQQLNIMAEKINLWKDDLAKQVQQFGGKEQKPVSIGDLRNAKVLMDDLRTELDRFIDAERLHLQERLDITKAEQRRYFVTLFLGATLALGALLLANLIIINIMAKVKATETELHNVQETYRLLLENLNDGIYDFYPETGKVEYSKTYANMLGYQPNEIGNDIAAISALIHPDDAENVWETIKRYAEKSIPRYVNTFRLRHKDGSWRWILSRGIGTWDKDGKLTRLLSLNTDISEQKRHEEELRQLNTDLEGFIYIVSHDLRAPLVNLKGFAGEVQHAIDEVMPLLKSGMASLNEKDTEKAGRLLDQEIPESLGFIRTGVERMDTLTTAILDLSRVGRREFQAENVSLQTIVKRCVDSLGYEISHKKIEVVYDNLPDIVSDPLALEQIFGNIIDNAIKYLDPKRPGKIIISARELPWETIFSVEDNGRGISGKDYQKVFDIFRRASNSGEVRGAGMGMAFVKAIVRKLGGRIWFDSVLDQGTTFYFSIPVRDAKATISRAA